MQTPPRRCPGCHAALEPGSPQGLCERCLLASLLPSAPSSSGLSFSSIDEPGDGPPDSVRFGSYELIEELGRGGMGIVYKARHITLDRLVAVKVVNVARPRARSGLDRFLREARAAASLSHPNIVPLFEVGSHGGEHFFSMRLVEGGQPLGRGGSPDPSLDRGSDDAFRRVAAILRDVALAVQHAHERGIIHRDIKPSNILVDAAGNPLLTDFGIAKLMDDAADLTLTNDLIGTPVYMAPELTDGDARKVTIAADVYSLGATLFELLTGRQPFEGGSSMEILRRVREDEPVRPSAIIPGLPRDLDVVCLKCLEKAPAGRYASAALLAEDLTRFLEHRPIAAVPATAIQRIGKWMRRRPAHAGLALTATLAALVFAGGLIWFNFRLRMQAERARAQLIRMSEIDAGRLQDEGYSFDALHRLNEAIRIFEDHSSNPAEFQRRRWSSIVRNGPSLEQIWFHDDLVNTVRFDSPGLRIASASEDHSARIWRVDGGIEPERVLVHPGPVTDAMFTPDGSHLVTLCRDGVRHPDLSAWEGSVRIWDLGSGDQVSAALPHLNWRYKRPLNPPVSIHPSGRWLARGSVDGAVVASLPEGRPVGSVLEPGRPVFQAAFNPSGDRLLLACAGGTSSLWAFDAADGTAFKLHDLVQQETAFGVTWDPTERYATAIDAAGAVPRWDLDSGESLGALVDPFGGTLFSSRFSSDGRFLLTASFSGWINRWDAVEGITSGAAVIHPGVMVADFVPESDLDLFYTCSLQGVACVWNGTTGKAVIPFLRDSGPILDASYHAAGSKFVLAGQSGIVRLWTLPDRHWRGEKIHPGSIEHAAFSIRGNRIASTDARGEARIGDLGSGSVVRVNLPPEPMNRIALSPDGALFAAADGRGHLHVHDSESGRPRFPPIPLKAHVLSLRFDRHGRVLAVGGSEPNGGGVLWLVDPVSGRYSKPLPHPGGVRHVSFHPFDSRIVASWGGREAYVWDSVSGSRVGTLSQPDAPMRRTAFSPDGRFLSTDCAEPDEYGPQAAKLWDARTLARTPREFRHQDGVNVIQFGPAGRILATIGQDRMIGLWDPVTGRPLVDPIAHGMNVILIAFSPDSRLLAAAATDSVRVWDVQTGEPVSSKLMFNGQILRIRFQANGRRLMLALADGSIRFVEVDTTSLSLDQLEARARVLSGMRSSASSDLLPLNRDELREAWRTVSDFHQKTIDTVGAEVPKASD